MRKTIVTFFIILCAAATYGQHSFRQKLDSLTFITFPDTVKTSTSEAGVMYKATKGNNIYVVILNDAVKKDPSMIIDSTNLNDLYNGIVEGTINSSKSIKSIYKKDILIGKLKGIELKYSNSGNPNKPFIVYQRVVYSNAIIFMYSFVTLDEAQKNNKHDMDEFFNSFVINDIRKKN